MECKKCGTTIPDDGIFCFKCGSRVDGKKFCSKCEKLIPEEAVFCIYCGERLIQEENKDLPKNVESVEEEILNDYPIIVPVVVSSEMRTSVAERTESDELISLDDDDEEESVVEAIICTQCGSSDIELISEDFGKCKNCGTQVVINTTKEPNIITNNVNIQMVKNFNENPISFFELPIQIRKEDFFAELLTEIALDKNSPEDFFTACKLEPIKTIYCQYLYGSGNVEMSYSATIGYDRQEEYYEKVKKWDSVKQANVYVEEKRTRTVTDWTPFSSTYKGTHDGMVSNGNQNGADVTDYYYGCKDSAKEYDAQNSKSPAPLAPTDNSIKYLKENIKDIASACCRDTLPGDHTKGFTSSGVVELTSMESHVAPRYVFDFSYNGSKYSVSKHTAVKSKMIGEYPSAKKENENEIENEKSVKTVNIMTFCFLLFAILSAILFPIALKITFTAISIIMFIINCSVKSKVSKEIYYRKQFKKKSDLIALLRKKGIKIPDKLKGGEQ